MFASRLGLWRRSRRVIECDGVETSTARRWLRSTFKAINNGHHEDFSLPAHVTATVPFRLVPDSRFSVTVVDTRGVDGSAVQPDILAHLKDERALILLCSKWGSAPDVSAQNLLTYAQETGADPHLLSRIAVLALAHAGDAFSVRHDSGEPPQDTLEGYDIKLALIEDAVQRSGISGVSAFVFDAGTDDSTVLTDFVLGRVVAIREARAAAARETIHAVDQLIHNRAEAQALAAMRTVSGNLERFVARNQTLRGARRPAHDRLVSAVTRLHLRRVRATTRRAGRF